MGTGDKETFPAAMRMLQQPFALVVRPFLICHGGSSGHAGSAACAPLFVRGAPGAAPDLSRSPRRLSLLLQEFPVGSAGLEGKRDLLATSGQTRVLLSTCMVQHHPVTGRPVLFHNNLNKPALNVPPYWDKYERRWRVVTPPLFS